MFCPAKIAPDKVWMVYFFLERWCGGGVQVVWCWSGGSVVVRWCGGVVVWWCSVANIV